MMKIVVSGMTNNYMFILSPDKKRKFSTKVEVFRMRKRSERMPKRL